MTAANAPTLAVEADLPKGWARARLPQLANINMGQSPPGSSYNKEQRGIPFFQGKAEFTERHPTVRVWCTQPKKLAKPGDVLISVRAPVGPTNVADCECAIGRGLAGLTPLADIPTEFLLFALRLQEPRLSLSGTGSTFTAISKDDLEEIEIDVPPLAEQKRIVEKVEQLLTRVNAVRERLARVPAILKRFRQAVLAAACSGRLTADWREKHTDVGSAHSLMRRIRSSHEKKNLGHGGKAAQPSEDVHNLTENEIPADWAIEELQFLCEPGRSITYGILKPGPNHPGGVPYIRVADFPRDRLNLDGIRKTTSLIADQYKRSVLRAGDVLLSIRGSVGRICRVPLELDGANITQDTARITVHPEMTGDYVETYLRCPSVQKRLEAAMKGVAVRGVNIGDVRVLQVAVPPGDEQREIVRRVEALFSLADTIEKRVAATTARAEKLTQAILAKAFRGELVPTEAELARREGRSYEPASALLARIRAERESASLTKSEPSRPGATSLGEKRTNCSRRIQRSN